MQLFANNHSRTHILYVLLTAATISGLAGVLTLSWFWNMESLEHEFDSEGSVISQYVREKMTQNETLLIGLYTYFKDKPSIEIESARHYAAIMASRFDHIHMFQAAKFVSRDDWERYVALMDSQGEDPVILRLVDGKGLVRITEMNDQQSVPVIMVEPEFEASRLGLDLNTISFIADHFPKDLSERVVLTEPFVLLGDELVMVMMQMVMQDSVPRYLSILVVKIGDLLPTVAEHWNLGINLSAIVGKESFNLVNQSGVGEAESSLLQWLTPLRLRREIEFRDYTLELTLTRSISWSDIKWGWLVVAIAGMIILPILYRMMFNIHARFEQLEEAQRKQLYKKANYDILTGLPNRHLFQEYAGRLLATAERVSGSVALLFLDLNGFKAVNDQLGHDEGDYVLELVGGQLQNDLRRGDMAARIGGDEFVVLIDPVESVDQLLAIIDRVRRAVDKVNTPRLGPLSISASIGFSYTDIHGYELSELMQIADKAMYEEKRNFKASNTSMN